MLQYDKKFEKYCEKEKNFMIADINGFFFKIIIMEILK